MPCPSERVLCRRRNWASSSFTSKCWQCIKCVTNVVLVPNRLPCRQDDLEGEEGVIITSRLPWVMREKDWSFWNLFSMQFSYPVWAARICLYCTAVKNPSCRASCSVLCKQGRVPEPRGDQKEQVNVDGVQEDTAVLAADEATAQWSHFTSSLVLVLVFKHSDRV